MNLLKQLWNWLRSSPPQETAEEPTPVEVEQESVRDVFLQVCAGIGVGSKTLAATNAVELFERWYDGDATVEAVTASLPAFIQEHGGAIAAKFSRFVK